MIAASVHVAVRAAAHVAAIVAAPGSADDAYDVSIVVIAGAAAAIAVVVVAWLVHRQYRATKRRRARHSARQRSASHSNSPLYEQRTMPTFGEGRDPRETHPNQPPDAG